MVGPTSTTFRTMKLHKNDNPSRLFSIVFEQQRTIDFAIPPSLEIFNVPQFNDLSQTEKQKFETQDGFFERDVTDEVRGAVFFFFLFFCRFSSFFLSLCCHKNNAKAKKKKNTKNRFMRKLFWDFLNSSILFRQKNFQLLQKTNSDG